MQGWWVLSHLRPTWSESYWRAVLETKMETEVVMDLDWYLASFLSCSFLLLPLLKMYPSKYFVRSSQCQGLYLGESKLWVFFLYIVYLLLLNFVYFRIQLLFKAFSLTLFENNVYWECILLMFWFVFNPEVEKQRKPVVSLADLSPWLRPFSLGGKNKPH